MKPSVTASFGAEYLRQLRATRDIAGWKPNPGPQTDFVRCDAFECLYGGAAGGGKTAALLHDVLRDVNKPSYRALLLRKTFPELERNVISESHKDYPTLGGRYNEAKKTWTFPSGARVSFGYLDSERDVYQYQGAEFQYIGWDELTHFSRTQYLYLLSRLRSAHGLKVRMRATTNPGGDGHKWVFERWANWLDPSSPHRASPGEVLRYSNTPDGEAWSSDGNLSRTFIPGKLSDTPQLAGSGYESQLMGLDKVTREQLLNGDWFIQPDGMALPLFDPAFHIRKHDNLGWSEVLVGCDWGWDDPGVFLLVGVRGNGQDAECHVFDEVYRQHEIQSYWVDKAREIHAKYPHARWYGDRSRPDNIENLRRFAGVNIVAADGGPGSIVAGIDCISNRLAKRKRHDNTEFARLYISPTCRNTIREFQEHRRKRDKSGIVMDEFEDKDNHAVDALRYALFSRFGRPATVRIERGPGW